MKTAFVATVFAAFAAISSAAAIPEADPEAVAEAFPEAEIEATEFSDLESRAAIVANFWALPNFQGDKTSVTRGPCVNFRHDNTISSLKVLTHGVRCTLYDHDNCVGPLATYVGRRDISQLPHGVDNRANSVRCV